MASKAYLIRRLKDWFGHLRPLLPVIIDNALSKPTQLLSPGKKSIFSVSFLSSFKLGLPTRPKSRFVDGSEKSLTHLKMV